MGGLVARYAALPTDPDAGHPRRLRVRRLFTIATPHNGAQLAPLGGLVSATARQMRHGSDFLERLNAALPDAEYDLIPYVRLGDFTVGPPWAAPPGRTPYWVSNRPLQLPHVMAFLDARFRADIVARLRGDQPPHRPHPRAVARVTPNTCRLRFSGTTRNRKRQRDAQTDQPSIRRH